MLCPKDKSVGYIGVKWLTMVGGARERIRLSIDRQSASLAWTPRIAVSGKCSASRKFKIETANGS